MIEKLEIKTVPVPKNSALVKNVGMDNESLFDKINELVDVVNALIKENNIHEKQVDELQMKAEPEKCEICCSEWEKQALDYKAENIALSGELERTRKALDVAFDALKSAHNYYEYCVQCEDNDCDTNWDCTAMNMDNDISEALEQIIAEQKDK